MSNAFWKHSTTMEFPHYGDFLILGGGFVGLSSAFWITEYNPRATVIIVEKDRVGSGASGKNAGFLTKGSQVFYHNLKNKFGQNFAEDIFNYVSESLTLLEEHILRFDNSVFEETSSMTIAANEELGFGNFKWNKTRQGWISTHEKRVHPQRLLELMRGILEKRKVIFLEGTEAISLWADEIETNKGRIRFGKLLMTLNGYSSRFLPDFKTSIFPKRAQMLAVRVAQDIGKELFYHPAERVYWRMTDHQTLIIGGRRLVDEVEENSDFEKINPKVQRALEEYLAKNLKVEFNVLYRWSGIMGFTDKELPIVEQYAHPQTYVAAGFSGHGMGFGFKTSQEIVSIMLGRKTATIFNKV